MTIERIVELTKNKIGFELDVINNILGKQEKQFARGAAKIVLNNIDGMLSLATNMIYHADAELAEKEQAVKKLQEWEKDFTANARAEVSYRD